MTPVRPAGEPEPGGEPDDGTTPFEAVVHAGREVPAQPEWRLWMQEFGQRLRRAREFLGATQDEIARLAGVSQGAVSRLETARGLATPVIVVMKVQRAVAAKLRTLDPTILGPALRRMLETENALVPPPAVEPSAPGSTSEHDIEDLVGLYRKVSGRHRRMVLAILKAAVDGLERS
jgi:transcriptional regulator with XRE-family HTH domain